MTTTGKSFCDIISIVVITTVVTAITVRIINDLVIVAARRKIFVVIIIINMIGRRRVLDSLVLRIACPSRLDFIALNP